MLATQLPRIEVKSSVSRLTVIAGSGGELTLSLTNATSIPDEFELIQEGLPPSWCSFTTPNLTIFPNWNEQVGLRIEVGPKARPDVYPVRVLVKSLGQPGIYTEVRVEVEVLAPLHLEARLQPRRARGFAAPFSLLIRNRTACEAQLQLNLLPVNSYVATRFKPASVRIGPGATLPVKFKVKLPPKTPAVQRRQPQAFQVQITPQWYLGQQIIDKEPVTVDGEYLPSSRFGPIMRHPILFGLGAAVVVLTLVWFLAVVPLVRSSFLGQADKAAFQGRPTNPIRVEQKAFAASLQSLNTLGSAFTIEVNFTEPDQKVRITLRNNLIAPTITGQIRLDAATSNLSFVPDDPDQLGQFPWQLFPPDQMTNLINLKFKRWLLEKEPTQKVVGKYIEGNTLVLQLARCETGDKACVKP